MSDWILLISVVLLLFPVFLILVTQTMIDRYTLVTIKLPFECPIIVSCPLYTAYKVLNILNTFVNFECLACKTCYNILSFYPCFVFFYSIVVKINKK